MMHHAKRILAGLLFLWIFSCQGAKTGNGGGANMQNLIPYSVIKELPHDKKAYTQGLLYYQGKVYESTGSEHSWIAEVDLVSGRQDKKVELDQQYFGEGITVLNDKVYQLTWKDKVGFIYDTRTFEKEGAFSYDFDGWGITTDGTYLIVSDGTEKLYYLDTLGLEVVKTLQIRENGSLVKDINELEYINEYILANQYESDYLLKIDPERQEVVGRVDLSLIARKIKKRYRKANVLNGIAYNPETGHLLITGKYWPKAFLIHLQE